MKISLKTKITQADGLVVLGNYFKQSHEGLVGDESVFEVARKAASLKKDFVIPMNASFKEIAVFYNEEKINNEELRKMGAKVAKMAISRKLKRIGILVKGFEDKVKPFVEGLIMGAYVFDRYLTEKPFKISAIDLVTDDSGKYAEMLNEAIKIGEATNFARDLVNTPAGDLSPDAISKVAKKMCDECSKATNKIYNESELKKMGMNALLAVGRGSSAETKMIVLEYKGGGKKKKPIALVGKGITFDSGGLHLKTGNYINHMKYDMTGAATVMGVFKIICDLKLPVNAVCIIPAAENMIDANVLKPNDIIKTYSGQTVEVINTDAEGRLVLCDALAYAVKKYDPEYVIDIATLTGACVTALGYQISAVMGNDQKIIDSILEAGKGVDEKLWQLPLDKDLEKKTKGYISDLFNYTAEPRAGAIMGGLFLSKFVGKTPWAHIDMGGTAWVDSEEGYLKKGATGRNVRTLWQLLKSAV
ncbi:leucyl aminopeptidase [Patescibacteria group bacterium]|nr:leucyl aminopeptidase [Patescibacteria group bacterium]